MANLSKEQIRLLEENKYIEKVSTTTISYSEEFKKEFMKRYLEGIKPKKIIKELGLDSLVLGKDRIKNITKRCKEYARREYKYSDLRKNETYKEARDELKKLKHEVLILRAENEYLKKKYRK